MSSSSSSLTRSGRKYLNIADDNNEADSGVSSDNEDIIGSESGKCKGRKKENRVRKGKHYLPLLLDSSDRSGYHFGFDRLPVVIYDLIHAYLSHYEYRQLMNCNKSVFHSIKYETVVLTLKGYNRWYRIFPGQFTIQRRLDYYEEMIQNNIKDRSKQIQMKVTHADASQLRLYQNVFNGISHLSISFRERTTLLTSLEFIRNISRLELTGLGKITHLNDLTGTNMIILKIENAPELADITNLSNFPKLTKVTLISCESISDISVLKDIPSFAMQGCPLVNNLSILSGNQKRIDYSNYHNSISSITKFKKVPKLKISANFSICDFQDAFTNKTIYNLTLKHYPMIATARTTPYSTPVPQLTNLIFLRLHKMDLSLWTSLINVKQVELHNCIINSLLCFKNVQILRLSGFGWNTIDLSSFLCLKKLYLKSLSNFIGFSKELSKTLEFISFLKCEKLMTLNHLANVACVELNTCLSLLTLDGLGNNKQVSIQFCGNIVNHTPLINVPDVTIGHHTGPINGNHLENVKKLSLVSCNHIINLKELRSVQELTLRHCSNVRSLTGLGNVRSLRIHDCKLLDDLDVLNEIIHLLKLNVLTLINILNYHPDMVI
jgi:hypothetical protein